MTEREQRDQGGDSQNRAGGDSEESLQEELRREAAEGSGSIGDTNANRNLSGSSTWETLPDSPDTGEASSS
jgi:hypothetical protein